MASLAFCVLLWTEGATRCRWYLGLRDRQALGCDVRASACCRARVFRRAPFGGRIPLVYRGLCPRPKGRRRRGLLLPACRWPWWERADGPRRARQAYSQRPVVLPRCLVLRWRDSRISPAWGRLGGRTLLHRRGPGYF